MPSSNIQALPDEFRQLPHMAVQGCLHGMYQSGSLLFFLLVEIESSLSVVKKNKIVNFS